MRGADCKTGLPGALKSVIRPRQKSLGCAVLIVGRSLVTGRAFSNGMTALPRTCYMSPHFLSYLTKVVRSCRTTPRVRQALLDGEPLPSFSSPLTCPKLYPKGSCNAEIVQLSKEVTMHSCDIDALAMGPLHSLIILRLSIS